MTLIDDTTNMHICQLEAYVQVFFKLLVFLAKEPCKRDYILQKRRMILRS